jgi:signal peptidase I
MPVSGVTPPPVRSRATRVVLTVGAVLSVLLIACVGVVVLGLHSLGWAPGDQTSHILGVSMAPTVRDGDYVIVAPYPAGQGPRAGDIVLHRDPYDARKVFIKRVLAGPGQRVAIRSAQVLVDGRALAEPYLAAEPWTAVTDWPPSGGQPVILGAGEYFVLGDNRNHSADSRQYGPVRRADILGRVERIILPRDRAGPV